MDLKVENDSLFIKSIIDTTLNNSKIIDDNKFIYGEIIIQNKQKKNIKYSNQNLKLVLNNSIISRTYKYSIASEVVDFSFMEISKNEKIKMKVYWVIDNKIKLSNIKLVYY